MKNVEFTLLLDFYAPMLTEKQREIMDLYYDQDLSLAEIADNYGITRQAVQDSIKRSEKTLLSLEEKLGMLKKHMVMLSGLEESIDLYERNELKELIIRLRKLKEDWEDTDGI